MNKWFYPKLAASNLKKNSRTYVPYLITCIATVLMYYIINAIAENQSLSKTYGGDVVKEFLGIGSWIICIFAVIFLFYTNSFLMKQRKKEFGLFNILGMEKRHISKVIFLETLYTALISLTVGLGGGILLSKLAELALFRLLHFEVQMGIEIVPKSICSALLLFGIIFALMLLNSLKQIHLSNPIELLKGSNVGEKEPKVKGLLAIIGFLCLGGGYYISLTVQSPVEAVMLFFGAVILVMIGTYCLFTAGSIAVLKLLKKNKKFYYQTRHFTSVSGMMYRMKQNAVGLANICILSTGVLVMLSTTCSLYAGMDDLMETRYPRDIKVWGKVESDQKLEKVQEAVSQVLKNKQQEPQQELNYRYINMIVTQKEGNKFYGKKDKDVNSFEGNEASLTCILLEDYERMTGEKEVLEPGEVLLYAPGSSLEEDTFCTGSLEYRIKKRVEYLPVTDGDMSSIIQTYIFVLPNEEEAKRMAVDGLENAEYAFSYHYGFNLEAEKEVQKQAADEMTILMQKQGLDVYAESRELVSESLFTLYGSLLFLGIFLGSLFVMAAVLIIYYKQITEGHEDKERFTIMKKVGMSQREVKSSIRSQVLTVFFLPLAAACVHTGFAYPVIKKLLLILNLSNTVIFIQTTVLTVVSFAVFYILVYSFTAKVYYKIVSA